MTEQKIHNLIIGSDQFEEFKKTEKFGKEDFLLKVSKEELLDFIKELGLCPEKVNFNSKEDIQLLLDLFFNKDQVLKEMNNKGANLQE